MHPSILALLVPRLSRGTWTMIGVGLAVVVVVVWLSPASPVALGRADALLGRGDAVAAARLYDSVALHNPWAAKRREALYRGAMVYATDLGDSRTARERLHQLAQSSDTSGDLAGAARAADAWEAIGHLLVDERSFGAAAQAFQTSWDLAPSAPDASRRLERAARARREAGDLEGAERTWKLLGQRYPQRRGTSLVSRGSIRLVSGDVSGALRLYDQAERITEDPWVAEVARLGAATCLERLGNLDEAIAVIDSLDLPEGVAEARREGIRARAAVGP